MDAESLRKAAHKALQKARGAGNRRVSLAANVLEFIAHGGMIPDDAAEARTAKERRDERLRVATAVLAAMLPTSPPYQDPVTLAYPLFESEAKYAMAAADALIAEVDRS